MHGALHAFDAAKVQGGIVTRTAYEGETFKALDGQEYTLNCTCLLYTSRAGMDSRRLPLREG